MRSERRNALSKTEVGDELQPRRGVTCLPMQLFAVDTVLDDCFQLVSLAYMTIGKNHEAPAVYESRTICLIFICSFRTGIQSYQLSR